MCLNYKKEKRFFCKFSFLPPLSIETHPWGYLCVWITKRKKDFFANSIFCHLSQLKLIPEETGQCELFFLVATVLRFFWFILCLFNSFKKCHILLFWSQCWNCHVSLFWSQCLNIWWPNWPVDGILETRLLHDCILVLILYVGKKQPVLKEL